MPSPIMPFVCNSFNASSHRRERRGEKGGREGVDGRERGEGVRKRKKYEKNPFKVKMKFPLTA